MKYKCPMADCGSMFEFQFGLRIHMDKAHGNVRSKGSMSKSVVNAARRKQNKSNCSESIQKISGIRKRTEKPSITRNNIDKNRSSVKDVEIELQKATSVSPLETISAARSNTCEKCGHEFESREECVKHMERHRFLRYKCTHQSCGWMFEQYHKLQWHYASHHSAESPSVNGDLTVATTINTDNNANAITSCTACDTASVEVRSTREEDICDEEQKPDVKGDGDHSKLVANDAKIDMVEKMEGGPRKRKYNEIVDLTDEMKCTIKTEAEAADNSVIQNSGCHVREDKDKDSSLEDCRAPADLGMDSYFQERPLRFNGQEALLRTERSAEGPVPIVIAPGVVNSQKPVLGLEGSLDMTRPEAVVTECPVHMCQHCGLPQNDVAGLGEKANFEQTSLETVSMPTARPDNQLKLESSPEGLKPTQIGSVQYQSSANVRNCFQMENVQVGNNVINITLQDAVSSEQDLKCQILEEFNTEVGTMTVISDKSAKWKIRRFNTHTERQPCDSDVAAMLQHYGFLLKYNGHAH